MPACAFPSSTFLALAIDFISVFGVIHILISITWITKEKILHGILNELFSDIKDTKDSSVQWTGHTLAQTKKRGREEENRWRHWRQEDNDKRWWWRRQQRLTSSDSINKHLTAFLCISIDSHLAFYTKIVLYACFDAYLFFRSIFFCNRTFLYFFFLPFFVFSFFLLLFRLKSNGKWYA